MPWYVVTCYSWQVTKLIAVSDQKINQQFSTSKEIGMKSGAIAQKIIA